MSQYTTGELARLCGVTVRTVQYYDTRGILIPSALTEGGRRLYSEEDAKKMKTICFLRDLGLSIDTVGQLLSEPDPGSVILLLLDQQRQLLQGEVQERQEKLGKLEELEKYARSAGRFSVESIGDVANIVESEKKLHKLRRNMILTGLPVTALQWAGILLWIFKGIWWVFALWVLVAIPYGIWASRSYYKNVAYICPQCHEVFKPAFKEMFWARHTPNTRKLTCTKCGHHGFCVETWGGDRT